MTYLLPLSFPASSELRGQFHAYLSRLVACGHKVDVLYARIFELLYSFDDVDYGGARANAYITGFRVEVFLY